jgi:predicted transcriptional regulator
MPRTSQRPKESSFNFRIDPALKAAFSQATEAEDKPAAQVLRDFMRAYVKQRERRAFQIEAQRQSLEAADHARDPRTDDSVSLKEFEALLNEDHFSDEWKA